MEDGRRKGMVVIIDDDDAARMSLGQMLRLRGYSTESFSLASEALRWPKLFDADCIVSDVRMPVMDGEEFLRMAVAQDNCPPVVMITGHGDVAMAVRCLKEGAYDFAEKPFDDDVLLASVARAVEKSRLKREGDALRKKLAKGMEEERGRFGMVGLSPAMQDLYQQVESIARSDAPALIIGETGSGKELVARAIHDESPRREGPFIPVNAGALPETMLESELFGHAKGAFTGAETRRDGKLVSASGGTLFLDEVESISKQAQIHLLRVIEDGVVEPLGSDTPRKVDVRIIASTKANLLQMVRDGRMREDFYHRLAVLPVHVPPLRDRAEDIPFLVQHFMRANVRGGEEPLRISENTLENMISHNWPGNVRELKNAIERMAITASSGKTGDFVPAEKVSAGRLVSLPGGDGILKSEMELTEKRVIEQALADRKGEVVRTAQALGISRRALYERMKKYNLRKEDFSD